MWPTVEGKLVKVFRRRDFDDAIAFVNDAARVAAALDHHPDVEIRWNEVTFRLFTHSAGAITEADHRLAAAIDALEHGGN